MSPGAVYSAEPAKGWIPWSVLAPFLCLVFVAAPVLALSGVLESFHLLDAKGDPVGLDGLFAFLVFPFGVTGLVVLAWVHLVERRPLATIGLAGTDGKRTFLRGHAIGIATSLAVVAAIWMAGGYEAGGYGRAFGSSSALLGIGGLLVGFAVQSSAEEILFRGWLLSVLARKLNLASAVVLSSIVFMLLHYGPGQHWLVTLGTFGFSLFASCWAISAGNIWCVMGWHTGWNWLLATGFELPVTGLDAGLPALLVGLSARGPDSLTGGSQGPEGSFLCSLFFFGASAFLVWRSRSRRLFDCGPGKA